MTWFTFNLQVCHYFSRSILHSHIYSVLVSVFPFFSGKLINFFWSFWQCFGSGTEFGFRGLLDPDPDSESGSGFGIWVRIQGLKKKSKMLNDHEIILLFSDFYNILSFNRLLLMIKTNNEEI